jgi:hypothetical protein
MQADGADRMAASQKINDALILYEMGTKQIVTESDGPSESP